MKIPILNLFYMLSYSWNCLDEYGIEKVRQSDYKSLKHLFTRVLINGCNHIIKRGLDRYYIPVEEIYYGIKGKLNLSESINRNYLIHGKTICEFDEFDYNIIHNQIIKATIYSLLRDKELDSQVYIDLRSTFHNFHKVDLISLNNDTFRKVKLHKNNRHYNLLLHICRYIFDNATLDERQGILVFSDFVRDNGKMAALFQSFVFNFLKKEQRQFKVRGEEIEWALTPIESSDISLLPKMRTDITMENKLNKVIIDTKYTPRSLITNYEKEEFHSANLYQLFSYLLNQEKKGNEAKYKRCTGVLLYPEVDKPLNQQFMHKEHKIIVRTVNLNKEWKEISNELLSLVNVVSN